MAEIDSATLSALLTQQDPASSDNSYVSIADPDPPTSPNPDAPTSTGQSTAEVQAILARVQELERRDQRHVEQIHGSRQEAVRWQKAFDDQQKANADLMAKVTAFLDSRGETTPRTDPVDDIMGAIEDVALDGRKDTGRQRLQQAVKALQPTTPSAEALTPTHVQAMIERDRETSRLRDVLLQDVAARNKDILDRPDAREALVAEYARLQANPLTKIQFPDDPTGVSTFMWEGQAWDLRVLDRAAGDLRRDLEARGELTQTRQRSAETLPAQGGGAGAAPPRGKDAIVVPAELVRGEAALFNDPRIRKAMETVTGLKDPRSHVKHVWDHVPEQVKAQWKRQAALGAPRDV